MLNETTYHHIKVLHLSLKLKGFDLLYSIQLTLQNFPTLKLSFGLVLTAHYNAY